MKTIPAGFTQTLELTVTDEMTVQFGELGAVHPVYATYWMAKHFEEAGRKIILPYLEEGDEGIGTQLEVFHTGSALPGMRVTVTATLQEVDRRRVVCALQAVNELGDEIGHGTTTQLVLDRSRIEAGFEQLRARFEGQRLPKE